MIYFNKSLKSFKVYYIKGVYWVLYFSIVWYKLYGDNIV